VGSESYLGEESDLRSEPQREKTSVASSESSLELDKLLEDEFEESLIWEGLPF
jgi:hypothetical protein